MPQFAATIKHLKDGVKGFTIAAAVKNIEGWETTLEKVEVSGVKTLHGDLEKLKKLLQADEIDGGKVKALLLKLGKETVTIAGRSDSKDAEKIKELGEALTHMADGAEDDGHDEGKKATKGAAKDHAKDHSKDEAKDATKDATKSGAKSEKKAEAKHDEKHDDKHKGDKKH